VLAWSQFDHLELSMDSARSYRARQSERKRRDMGFTMLIDPPELLNDVPALYRLLKDLRPRLTGEKESVNRVRDRWNMDIAFFASGRRMYRGNR
jgi:hypothetical protein